MSSFNCVNPKQPMHLLLTIQAHIYESSATIGGDTSNCHGHLIVSHHASIWSQSAVTAPHTHFTSPCPTYLSLRFSCALHCMRQDPDSCKHSMLLSYSAAKHINIHACTKSQLDSPSSHASEMTTRLHSPVYSSPRHCPPFHKWLPHRTADGRGCKQVWVEANFGNIIPKLFSWQASRPPLGQSQSTTSAAVSFLRLEFLHVYI